MREVDGIKVAFVESDSYFESLNTPSMTSTARETGADVVLLLAPGVKEAELDDALVRELLAMVPEAGLEPARPKAGGT